MATIQLDKAYYPKGTEHTTVNPTAHSETTLALDVAWVRRVKKSKAKVTKVTEVMQPLDISLTRTANGQWVADEMVTLQFGVGAAPKDAVSDLMQTLADYRDVLRARRYRLTPYLREQLKWLEAALH